MKTSKFAIASLLLAFAGATSAQQAIQPARAPAQNPQATQQQLTPDQQAQVARQDAEMTKAAAQVVQLVDQNKAAEVWAGASPVAKGAATLDEFVKQIALDRQKHRCHHRAQTGGGHPRRLRGGWASAGRQLRQCGLRHQVRQLAAARA